MTSDPNREKAIEAATAIASLPECKVQAVCVSGRRCLDAGRCLSRQCPRCKAIVRTLADDRLDVHAWGVGWQAWGRWNRCAGSGSGPDTTDWNRR